MKRAMKRFILATICIIIAFCASGCSKSPSSAIGVVKKYWYVEKWEDRLQYVKNTDTVRNYMAEKYKNVKFPLKAKVVFKEYKDLPNEYTGWTIVTVKTPESIESPYFVQKTDTGYIIDWEASLPYNPMSWAEFKATKPTVPVRYRVIAKLSDYYNYEFRDMRDTYWSFSLSGINYDISSSKEYILLNGYIEKNTQDGSSLYKFFKDSQEYPITIEIKFVENSKDISDGVLITKFVSDTTFIKDN